MKMISGAVEPGIRIGDFHIGGDRTEIISKLGEPCEYRENGSRMKIYSYDNFALWFDSNDRLDQIGVTKGFCGDYKSITVGSTMGDVKKIFGQFESEDIMCTYTIVGVDGICFELEDNDDWDELTTPIEWIYVYRCAPS